MIDRQIEQNLTVFLDKDYGAETFAKWAGNLLSVELEPNEFHNLDFESAQRQAKDVAERMTESQIFEAVEENLPESSEEDWNWEALAKFANSRWKTNLSRPRFEESRPQRRVRIDAAASEGSYSAN